MCGLCFLICLGVFYTQSEAYLGECPCELEKNVCSTLGNVFLLTRSHLSLSSGGGKRSSRLCSSVCGTALRAGAARLCGGGPTCARPGHANSRSPARRGPGRDVGGAAAARPRLRTGCRSPSSRGPAHLGNKQVFRKGFMFLCPPKKIC